MRGRTWWLAGCLSATGALAAAGPSWADGCSDCGPPTKEQLEREAGFQLLERAGFWGLERDYYETSGGECRLSLDGAPTVQKKSEWIEAELVGEAFYCPQGKMTSRVRLALQHSEKYDWHLEVSFGEEIDVPLLGALKAGIGGGGGSGSSSSVVAEIDQVIEAAYCHRLGWMAYFIVGDFSASCPFNLERRFSWWTKNANTGYHVHASGQVWIQCEGGTGVMAHWAPISSHVAINDRTCKQGCQTTVIGFMGWYPPLPPRLKPYDPFKDEPPDDDGAPNSGFVPGKPPPRPPTDPNGPPPEQPPSPTQPPKPPDPQQPPAPNPPPDKPPDKPPDDSPPPDGGSGSGTGGGGPDPGDPDGSGGAGPPGGTDAPGGASSGGATMSYLLGARAEKRMPCA